ncbi:MAG: carbamoyl-phosphate synthase large subunit [Ilumatobacter sp.]|uniref:carbamoyl-phosphate synthase large subunit n=1 Tax=Ilumatobacter sp. TaxID=1967498 RepID=UPI0026327142|nr:carbamoyl-phosphate synthase large subunit [Ilumatobacter sp.]MDJ0769535.1 carbamoyl-phosphate synthase large subunit [Ilumatobacter sp.]
MPRRDDIESILIIGSGPIVIGQACEFDYSGTQACRVLREEGYRVILANSNPATIMTDPDFADATYVEPLTWEVLATIIEREQPDAVLPTLGGQTGLNVAMQLFERGLIGVPGTPEMIGANADAIATAEDRERFKEAMIEIGLDVPRSGVARDLDEARKIVAEIGLPVIIRPAYILGGRGTGIASDDEEFERVAANGLAASPIGEILIEESIAGWKEYELEVMRDRGDNCVIICSIENVDPMGVHTGDSITVAPQQTLTDVEYQQMRDAALACIRRVGVETGGSNVQFAVDPATGRQVVIEMNPRVSRSSALASKATGFPIAKIAAKLAVGYTLDEIPNDITKATPASFEPVIDYVVTKIPRWAFEKLPGTSGVLGTQMQSVGEVMSIGRTFPESLQKGLRSLEQGRMGLNADQAAAQYDTMTDEDLLAAIAVATPDRIFQVGELLHRGRSIEEVHDACRIDPWFLDQMSMIVEEQRELVHIGQDAIGARQLRRAKRLGFSDAQLAHLWGSDEATVRSARKALGVLPTYKTVDTCAAEFAAETPYHYSTYEDESEVRASERRKVVILGSGPNRIGQGIEFDYCCVHASFALRDAGYETVMVNCNPETVSTDYDTSDRLYFEPLTKEDVLNVIDAERPHSVIVSLGGQTPLKLAGEIPPDLVAGTSAQSIDDAEDREKWNQLCDELNIPQPAGGTAVDLDQAYTITDRIGFPVLVRPSYVLGGRAMQIVDDRKQLAAAMDELSGYGSLGKEGGLSAERPVLIDRFLGSATEVDVDAIRDHTGEVIIGGIMEHVEEAGVHSGDSACAIPPQTLPDWVVEVIKAYTEAIAQRLDVRGLINVQFAVAGGVVYVIEANPRASRTVPFVAKARGIPLAKVATRVMLGATLAELRDEGLLRPPIDGHVAVKEAVLPFTRFPEVDPALGPEMRSTGEVMGIDSSFGRAFFKAEISAGNALPTAGTVFLSVNDQDKPAGLVVAKRMRERGLGLVATKGTADYLASFGVEVDRVLGKVQDADGGQTAVDLLADGTIVFVVNTPRGSVGRSDGEHIRKTASMHHVGCVTTVSAALAAAQGLGESPQELPVRSLQEYHAAGEGGSSPEAPSRRGST